ncbi:hypothetical protein [Pseudochrobactrum sp. MP213Fo]|uniref:hypothetical protein n=1 Tax=Pseudochrobactrum sp. MP213Fo TaxID=3022250 RepID=UPI003B9E0356
MVARVYIDGNEPRIITSKAGKEAGPALPDADKTFDSRWYSGGGIRWNASNDIPNKADLTVRFPGTLGYVPKVWINAVKQWNGDQELFDASGSTPGLPSDFRPPHDGYVISNELGCPTHKIFNNRVEFGYASQYWPWRYGKMVCLVYGE